MAASSEHEAKLFMNVDHNIGINVLYIVRGVYETRLNSKPITVETLDDVCAIIKAKTNITSVLITKRDDRNPESDIIIGGLVRALENMDTVTQFRVFGKFTSAFCKTLFHVLSKLPITNLGLTLYNVLTQDDMSEMMLLRNIDTLRSFTFYISTDVEYEIAFISSIMQRVSILKTLHLVKQQVLTAISERLAEDASTVEILKINTNTSLAILGDALKTNTGLKSLVFTEEPDESLNPIFDALATNSSLLKLQGYFQEGDEASLIRMLRTNTMLEILDLSIDIPRAMGRVEMAIFSNEYADEFVSALNRSSLVDLTLQITVTHNSDRFVIKLLVALKTNRNMKHLRLILDRRITIDAKVVVELLTNNTTLETFYIDHLRVTNEHRLGALVSNQTVIDVASDGPQALIDIAARNLDNKSRRDATLFGLSARQFL